MAWRHLPFGVRRLLDLRDLARDGMEVLTPEETPRVRTVIQLDGDMINAIDGTWLSGSPDDLAPTLRLHRANLDRRLARLRRPFVLVTWFSRTVAAIPMALAAPMAWRAGTMWWVAACLVSPVAGWCIHRVLHAAMRRAVLRRLHAVV